MKLTEAHRALVALPNATFTTNDAATLLGIESSHATKVLTRLSATGHVLRLARGRWALPDALDPFLIPEALTAPLPSYISLHTALHHHGLIEQIPSTVYAVTLAPSAERRAPDARGHGIAPSCRSGFFFGFETAPGGAKVARSEKALLDFLYLRPGRSRRFRSLPELTLPRGFSATWARGAIDRIAIPVATYTGAAGV
ncbi:MAG TPA: hypothetical protein PKD61_28560, partial [Polyangiaceae bacterium]|nr:hypothetical protein [Polyangiaceae bacterium]